ncbi:hypothetical protein AMTRI_Chr09g35410 [Amborella trichopoda]
MIVPATRNDLMIVNMGPHHPSMHATMFTEAMTVNPAEELGNIQVPRRASYIRVIMLELSRIASHLLWLISRALLYDLFETATGMRMMHNFFHIGGVAADLPHGCIDNCLDFCDYFLLEVTEYQKPITHNPIFLEREAINWGLSGPMLRASGIPWDLRKVDHYEYSLARYLVRISEMIESVKIIQQALEGILRGAYENLEARRFDRLVKRMKLADIMTILGSMDIIMGEVNR